MPKIISYTELNELLKTILDGETIDHIRFAYPPGGEQIELVFKSDSKITTVHERNDLDIECLDCGYKWVEPRLGPNANCPKCCGKHLKVENDPDFCTK